MSLKIYAYLILGAVILGGFGIFVYHQRSIGADAERAKQDKANAQFKVRVNQGAVDFDTCERAGGLYQFGKGTCKLP